MNKSVLSLFTVTVVIFAAGSVWGLPEDPGFSSYSAPYYWNENAFISPSDGYQTAKVTLKNAWTLNDNAPQDLDLLLGFRGGKCVTAWFILKKLDLWGRIQLRDRETTLKLENGTLSGALIASVHAQRAPTIQYEFDATVQGATISGAYSGMLDEWPEGDDGRIVGSSFSPRTVSGAVSGEICDENCMKSRNALSASKDWPTYFGPNGSFSAKPCDKPLVRDLANARPVWKSEDMFGTGWGDAPDMRYGCLRPMESNIASGATTPVIANGVLYYYYFQPSADSTDVGEAREKWQSSWDGYYPGHPIAEKTLDMTKTYADDVIIALDAATGQLLWKRVFVKSCRNIQTHKWRNYNPTPTIRDGIIYVQSYSNTFYALDAATGEDKWIKKTYDNDLHELGPVIAGNMVIRLSRENEENPDRGSLQLFAFDRQSGDLKWQYKEGRYNTYRVFPWKSSSNQREYLLALNISNGLHSIICLDPDTKDTMWSKEAEWGHQGSKNTPLVAGDNLVCILGEEDSQGEIVCYGLSPDGLTEKWSFPAPDQMRGNYGISIIDGKVYIDSEFKLHCRNLETGELLDSLEGVGGARSQFMWASNDRLFIQRDGRHGKIEIQMIDISNGNLKALHSPDNMWYPPHAHTTSYANQHMYHIIADGRLFMRGADAIYCYDLRDKNPGAAKEKTIRHRSGASPGNDGVVYRVDLRGRVIGKAAMGNAGINKSRPAAGVVLEVYEYKGIKTIRRTLTHF